MLEQTAATASDRPALIYFGSQVSYGQLLDQVNRLAAGLQSLGLKKGDRVAIMMPNCPQFVIAFFGVLRAGGIVTPTSSMYTPREVTEQWNDAGAVMVIADRRLYPVVQAGLPQLNTVRKVILTGIRDYYPAPLRRFYESLQGRAPGNGKANGRPVRTIRNDSPPPEILEWKDLLRISSNPAPDGLAQADIACLQYTGGTTGKSKGAMLTHANLVINAHQFHWSLKVGSVRQEMAVAALPLFHVYALLCVMIASVKVGGSIIILPRFELKPVLNTIRKYRPTVFHGVPTMYVAFNSVPNLKSYGVSSLQLCTSGGAPLPIEVRQRFQQLTGANLVEGYGLTETSPVTHFNPPTGVMKSGSIGLPILGTQVRIMDLETGEKEIPPGEVGEIVIKGPQVMLGYWKKPEETARVLRDGWFYTGDVAKMDSDGYFYIVDRKKDMIIAGGFNVYPREVEEVLFGCPLVKEAGVIGIPDEYRGETVKAFVVLKDGITASADEIISYCRERLAAYKVPRQVVFRDSLPRSAVGKYLRRELRNL
jgi:long-chain acyl-CoA synthetase